MPVRRTLNDKATKLIQGAAEQAPNRQPIPVDAHFSGDELPPVDHPDSFKPEPFVNDPEVQQLLHEILKVAPGLGRDLNHIQVGDSPASQDYISHSAMRGHPMDYTSLLGVTDKDPQSPNDVALNPNLLTMMHQHLPSTLVHELMHTVGYGEKPAYEVGDKLDQFNIFDKGKQ